MRWEVYFYQSVRGDSPIEDFLDDLPSKGASQMRRVHGGIGRARFRITALVYRQGPWKHLGASPRMGRDRVPILLCSHDRPALGGLARDQEKVTKGESEGYRAGRSAAQRGNREVAS